MTADDWLARIQAAQQAARNAAAREEQTIRDAVADGLTPSDVARALGTKNRQRVYAVLARGEDGDTPTAPAMTAVVYLRGAGNPPENWERVERAMWARGWVTVRDRTAAFHLARGGAPVVLCDFSTDLDDTPGSHYGYDLYVVVGRVRARYQDTTAPGAIGSLLPASEYRRLFAEGADWLSVDVLQPVQVMELPLVNGGKSGRPSHRPGGRLDEQALARLVAAALAN